jgi:hypothetical protein
VRNLLIVGEKAYEKVLLFAELLFVVLGFNQLGLGFDFFFSFIYYLKS